MDSAMSTLFNVLSHGRTIMRDPRIRLLSLALLLCLVLLSLPASVVRGQDATPRAAGATAAAHVLRIGRVGLNPTFDPQRNDWSFAVPALAYEGLTKLDADLHVAPAAADSGSSVRTA